MPSYYIVLEKQITGAGTFVNGNLLSKNSDALEKLAKKLCVTSLMSFFSVSKEDVASLFGDSASVDNIPVPDEKWFSAEDGLRTVNTLLKNLSASRIRDSDRVEGNLREFVRVLELAKSNGIRWHLAIDY